MKVGLITLGIICFVLTIIVTVMVTRDVDRTSWGWNTVAPATVPAQVIVATPPTIQYPVQQSVQGYIPTTHQPYGIMNDGGVWTGKINVAAKRVFGPIQVYGGYSQYSLPLNVRANTISGSTVSIKIYVGGDGDIFFDTPVPANNITAIFLP